MRTRAVGIVVPAHDEEDHLAHALDGIGVAAGRLEHRGIDWHVAVVLDACSDRSSRIARRWRSRVGAGAVSVVEVDFALVGAARRAGGRAILGAVRGLAPGNLWLASTDADSVVPPAWLTHQVGRHEAGASLWSGSVTVPERAERDHRSLRRWGEAYAAEERPIHGASLGVRASTYLAAGEFACVATGEDRALHAAALAVGAVAEHDRCVPVVTSARRTGRAPRGFAGALDTFERTGALEVQVPAPSLPLAGSTTETG